MKRIIISIIFTLLFSTRLFAFDDGDFQWWHSESAIWKIKKDWKARVEEEFRLGDNGGNLYYQHTDLGIGYSGLAKWLDIGLNYRLVYEKSNSKWEYENRPHLNIWLKLDLGSFNLSDRHRFEFRDKEEGNDGWRYREKFTLKFPKFTKLELQPYIADEIFVDFDKEQLNRNRLYFGADFRIYKSLMGELFYLWQNSKSSGKWSDCNVLGTKLKLAF